MGHLSPCAWLVIELLELFARWLPGLAFRLPDNIRYDPVSKCLPSHSKAAHGRYLADPQLLLVQALDALYEFLCENLTIIINEFLDGQILSQRQEHTVHAAVHLPSSTISNVVSARPHPSRFLHLLQLPSGPQQPKHQRPVTQILLPQACLLGLHHLK
jgi:hypothetical protein